MSKYNKVNPGQYKQGGRLTPDEMARQRMKQHESIAEAEAREQPDRPGSNPVSEPAGEEVKES